MTQQEKMRLYGGMRSRAVKADPVRNNVKGSSFWAENFGLIIVSAIIITALVVTFTDVVKGK